jgi:hypothetical protein
VSTEIEPSEPQGIQPAPQPTAIINADDWSNPVVGKVFAAIEREAGGRETLASLFSQASASQAEEAFILDLSRPDPKLSLSRLCHKHGITLSNFLSFISRAEGAHAYMESNRIIYRYLPKIVEQTMQSALPTSNSCSACGGLGKFIKTKGRDKGEEAPCKFCNGQGTQTTSPDPQSVKLALQISGLLKSEGVRVGIQVNANGGGTLPTKDLFRTVMGTNVVTVKARVIEAEAATPSAPAEERGPDVPSDSSQP